MFQVDDISSGEQKIVSRSKARIIDNQDPQKKGRVRVFHPLLGETGFIPYLSAPGSFSVPDIDDVVFVEAEAGYPTHCLSWGNLNSEDNGSPAFPDVFQRVIPTNRGFFTPDGHLVELDDGKGITNTGQGIRITTSGGNKITILEDTTATEGLITLETSGGLTLTLDGTKDDAKIETTAGASIEINGLSDKITISNSSGAEVLVSPATIDITDALGNEVALTSSGVKVMDVGGGELNLSTGKVALGNHAGELFQQLVTLLQAFTTAAPTFVSTAVGPGVLDPGLAAAIASATTVLTAIQGSL